MGKSLGQGQSTSAEQAPISRVLEAKFLPPLLKQVRQAFVMALDSHLLARRKLDQQAKDQGRQPGPVLRQFRSLKLRVNF